MKVESGFRVIAGDYIGYRELIERTRGNTDTDLCRAQIAADKGGWRGWELIPTIYGWSLREASGLQNFALIAGSMTLRQAVAMARRATKQNPRLFTVMRRDALQTRRQLSEKFGGKMAFTEFKKLHMKPILEPHHGG